MFVEAVFGCVPVLLPTMSLGRAFQVVVVVVIVNWPVIVDICWIFLFAFH